MEDAIRRDLPDPDTWNKALDGDRDAFEAAIEPHREALLRNARVAVMARSEKGELPDGTITPEELAGETLVRAFDGRERFDRSRLGFRTWLLALQQRALNRIASDENNYRQRKAISLQEEVPFREEYDAVEEAFYEFNDPFDVTTYDELIPSQSPDDVEIDTRRPLTEDELQFLERSGLDPSTRQVVELHDEFEMPISDVAQVLEQSLSDTAEALNSARVHVRQWLGTTDVRDVTGDESRDSYTGDRIERLDIRD